MPSKLPRFDGIFRPAKQLVLREWRSHPLRYAILLVAFIVAATAGGYNLVRQPGLTQASSHKFMAFWDGTTPPSGWICVSCTGGDDFFQVFPRGAATAGGTGGAATHDHSQAFVSHTNASTLVNNRGGQSSFTTDVHTHGYTGDLSGRTATATSLPIYQNLKVIRYDTVGNPPDIPDGVIVLFDADPGTGWTRYSAQDSDMIRGENDATGTGGAANHTHTFSGTLTATANTSGRTGSSTTAATDVHTHTVSGTTDTSDHTPLYRDVLLYKNTSGSAKSLVGGEIFMATGDPGSGWTSLSGASGAFENRFLRGAATYGGTGGVANHTPANDVNTSGTPSATAATSTGNPPSDFGGAAHTHSVTNSFGSGDNLPPYRDTIIAKKNTPGISIQGTVYMANESTLATSGNGGPCDGSTAVISIRVEGGTAATGTCSNSTATFDIETNQGASAGQPITVYLTSSMKANTVYLSDSTADTGIDLYQNRLAVGHKNAGPIVITDMDAYDSDQNDTDMLFDAEDLSTDTLIVEAGNELHIRSGETFTPGGAVTTPTLHIVGTFSAGSFTHLLNGTTGPMITLDGGGDLVAGTSTIQIVPDASVTLTSGTFTGSDAFNNLRLGDNANSFTTNRTYTFGSGEILINGNFTINPLATTSGVTITVNMGAPITVTGNTVISANDAENPTVVLNTTGSNYSLTSGTITTTSAGGTGVPTLTANASVITLTATSGALFSLDADAIFNEGTSEVRVTSASGTPRLITRNTTFHILTINSTATVINQTFNTADITLDNDTGSKFHIQSGTFNTGRQTIIPGTSSELDIDSGGKLCIAGTFDGTNSTCDSGVTESPNTQLPAFTTFTLDPNSTIRYLNNFNTYSVSNTPVYGNLELATKTANAVQNWELAGPMTINGNFTIDPNMCDFCTFDVDANGTITVANGKTTTITESGTGDSQLDLNPDGTPRTLNTGNLSITTGNDLRVETSGTSAINVSGTWTNNGVFVEGNSTVTLNGTTSTSFNSGCTDTDACTDQNFYNLTIDKTDADEANDNVTLTTNGVRVSNLLTITDGELVQGTLNVRAEGTSAVSIAAAGEWNNISTGDLKLGGTFVNEGAAIFNSNNGTQCVDAADDIAITSTSGGSQRAWSGAGTFTLRNLDVTDMTDSSITAYTSNFTNTTWTQGSCGTIVSGGCFTDESEGAACTDDGGNAIKIAVNGVVDPASDPVVGGSWSVTTAVLSTNDILVIFIDGEATESEEATTIVKYDGTGNITNVKLYQSQLVIGTDSGSTNSDQTITAADLNTGGNGYENSDDEDVLYDYTAGADITVDAEGTHTEQLYIMNGDTYRPASGGGSDTTTHNLEIDTGATITADSNNFTVGGSWNNGGTFTAGSGTVAFNTTVTGNTLSGTLNGAGGSFNNVTFTTTDATATDDWEIQATMAVANDFTLSAGNIDSNNNSLTVTRDYTLTNATNTDYDAGSSTLTISRHFNDTGNKFVRGTSTVILNGTGNVNTTGNFNNLSYAFTSQISTLNTSNFAVHGQMTFNGGTANATAGGYIGLERSSSGTPVVFASATTLSGSKSMYHSNNANSLTTTIAAGNYGTWNVITFTTGAHTSSTYQLAGNITTTGYVTLQAHNSSTGNVWNTQDFDVTALRFDLGSESRVGPWTVNFGAADFDLSDTGSSFGVVNNGGTHTFNLSTANIVTDGDIRFVQGTGTIAASGSTSTITMTPAAAATRTFYTNAQTIDNFVVNGGAGSIVLLSGDLIPSDNLTITAGTLDVSASNYIVTIGGNYSNSGTFDARASTVVFNATDTGNTLAGTMTGSSAFNALTFNGSGGEWTPSAAITVEQHLTMTAGTLLGTQNITVNQNVQGTAGVINLSGGTFELATNDAARNFGTTSGSAAWTFNNLTFRDTCVSTCVIGNVTITTQTGGTGGITVGGVLTVSSGGDSELVDLDAGNRTWTLSGTGGDPFLLNAGSDLIPSTSTFSYTGNNTGGDTTVQAETYNNLTVNNGSEIYNLEGATVGVDVTVTAGELKLNGQTLTATNDLTVNGTLSGTTNVTVNGTVTGSGTVTLTGGTFEQKVAANETFGSSAGTNEWRFATLIFSNSSGADRTISPNAGTGTIRVDTLLQIGQAADTNNTIFDNNTANDRVIDCNLSINITSKGSLTASNSQAFTVGDDWTNSGTFTHSDGTVTFDTTATAVFAGATTFYGFTSTTAAKTLQFTAGQTFTIATGGLLTLTGAADPNEIQIQSTSATNQWFINHQGSESVSFVQVVDSGCDVSSTDISTTDSVDDGNNGSCWLFGSTFAQGSYRFGQPNGLDIDYTGAPAENAAYTTSGTGDDFRLRMLINVSGSNLAQNGNDFKLQFGEKTGATCTSGVSWGDVATGSGVIRYFDGGGRVDGDNLTGNVGDPDDGNTVVDQDYEEANNFTNSVAAINSGQDGMWDFSLVNNSAVGGKRYCFKAVDVTGATDLAAYNQYPEVIVDEELIFTLDATSKDWGVIQPGDNPTNQTSTLTTSTNSSTGYVIYAWTTQAMTLTNGFGSFTIPDWTGTNADPTSFPNGSFGFGYSTDDVTLTGGTADRFNPGGGGVEYAGFTHTGPGDPVADRTTGPVTGASDQITYRLAAGTGQEAGKYETVVVYVASVTF